MTKPVVHLYTVCWDEADMLGFFFRHYDAFVDRYVVYDDGSTDGSRAILQAHPKVELRDFARVDAGSFVLSHKAMQDEAWKESRGRADWVVVTAIDEHLHVRGRAMADYLAEQAGRGVTMIPALGFDMNHPVMPDDEGLLTERIVHGRPRIAFNKLSLFDPDAVTESGFGAGRHDARPAGTLRMPARDEVMLWHYKHLGFERNAAREAEQAARLGTVDVAKGYGEHYRWGRERLRAFWDEMERDSFDLSEAGFDPAAHCIHPLWWSGQPEIVRVPETPRPALPAAPRTDPTVSVLVKAYNHAPYARQTIQSILDQSFQDFEIVVTDDASTDGTLGVLRGFDDPRIRLEALPTNHGISLAMNATIARARGRYLAILNSDDWALPGRLERQAAFLDAHPDVALVFGKPQMVGEAGESREGFNDFDKPLRWPDQSRGRLLRALFYEGNCLCAPTAMIRREVYDTVGLYDPRLTNLQDLDMWVRALIAGYGIRVLPEATTAFRIRANDANMSADRPDSRTRHFHELSKILGHFTKLDEDLFREVFGSDAGNLPSDMAVDLRIAHLASRTENVAHRNFAVGIFYERAACLEDYHRLRHLTGTIDALNVQELARREYDAHGIREEVRLQTQARRELEHEVAARSALASAKQAEVTSLQSRLASYDAMATDARARFLADRALQEQLRDELRALEARLRDTQTGLAETQASRARLRASLSWRITAPLRWIGRLGGF